MEKKIFSFVKQKYIPLSSRKKIFFLFILIISCKFFKNPDIKGSFASTMPFFFFSIPVNYKILHNFITIILNRQ